MVSLSFSLSKSADCVHEDRIILKLDFFFFIGSVTRQTSLDVTSQCKHCARISPATRNHVLAGTGFGRVLIIQQRSTKYLLYFIIICVQTTVQLQEKFVHSSQILTLHKY